MDYREPMQYSPTEVLKHWVYAPSSFLPTQRSARNEELKPVFKHVIGDGSVPRQKNPVTQGLAGGSGGPSEIYFTIPSVYPIVLQRTRASADCHDQEQTAPQTPA